MSTDRDLRAALQAVESLLAERAALRAQQPDDSSAQARALSERVDVALAHLETVLATCGASTERVARRVAAVQSAYGLQTRATPPHVLAGLYDAVRAAASDDPWGRAGMSLAFLDAPRALVRWRLTALAACALLAVGGWVFLHAEPGATNGTRSLADPRDELLRRLDAPAPAAMNAVRSPWSFGSAAVQPTGTGRPSGGQALWLVPDSTGRDAADVARLLDGLDVRFRIRPARPPAAGDARESN
ncbi:MAG: hypothetical protein O2894_12170 [Planctomycetota bacterium]|nr:hypothetical protein [Planctomycetota bacterium]